MILSEVVRNILSNEEESDGEQSHTVKDVSMKTGIDHEQKEEGEQEDEEEEEEEDLIIEPVPFEPFGNDVSFAAMIYSDSWY
jgi:hypothetical protein